MSQDHDMEVQRSLGRIESDIQGLGQRMLSEIRLMREEFAAHKQDDQRNFSSLRLMIKEKEQAQLAKAKEQDKCYDDLKADSDRAKGAGYVILGLVGALATFIGTATIAALKGILQIKFHFPS